MARPSWENGSGGVKTAAIATTPTMAYLRPFLSWSAETTPMRPSSVRTTGSWKHMPKARIKVIVRLRYSETRGSMVIDALFCSPPLHSKLAKKLSATGIIKKNTSAAPATNRNGVAIR